MFATHRHRARAAAVAIGTLLALGTVLPASAQADPPTVPTASAGIAQAAQDAGTAPAPVQQVANPTLAPDDLVSTGLVTREAVFTAGVEGGWASVERYQDANPGFQAEVYPADGRGDQVGQTALFFGSAQPHSSRFLLYNAPAPAAATGSPVLLVHGANQTASQAWANPNAGGNFGCGVVFCPSTGLMQHLVDAGHPVYAIGFPHRNGDGYYWAEQIGDAVEVIRAKTGAAQVDVIGWSKGAFNARMYVSSVTQPWGSPYSGNVSRLILLGNPSMGFDWGYRHGISHDGAVFPECGGTLNAPAAHTQMTCYGWRFSHPELSYASPAFPGSGQMLARWDGRYPLPYAEPDWYTTYYGGTGFYSRGVGIQAAIDEQSLVQTIVDAGTPPELPVYLLCGTAPTMAGLHNEHTGPSDGAVFVLSCASEQGIANHAATATPFLNHLQLGWSPTSMAQVTAWLN
ncbi:MAG: esterase/lipase family protein [Actinomycetales bacterium]